MPAADDPAAGFCNNTTIAQYTKEFEYEQPLSKTRFWEKELSPDTRVWRLRGSDFTKGRLKKRLLIY